MSRLLLGAVEVMMYITVGTCAVEILGELR